MLNWKDFFQYYIVKNSNRIKKTTRPLRDHFGINSFFYHRIDHMGKFAFLCDRPDWLEYCISEQLFTNDPWFRHPSVYQTGTYFMNNFGSEEHKGQVTQGYKKILNVDMGSFLFRKEIQWWNFLDFMEIVILALYRVSIYPILKH